MKNEGSIDADSQKRMKLDAAVELAFLAALLLNSSIEIKQSP